MLRRAKAEENRVDDRRETVTSAGKGPAGAGAEEAEGRVHCSKAAGVSRSSGDVVDGLDGGGRGGACPPMRLVNFVNFRPLRPRAANIMASANFGTIRARGGPELLSPWKPNL